MLQQDEKKKSFLRRLKFYGFGVVLGLALVYVLLIRGRDFGFWTPQNRVLEKIRKTELLFTNNAECMMQCLNISKGEIRKVIDSLGVVNFDQSNVHTSSCHIYMVEDKDRYEMQFLVESCDSTSTILNVSKTNAEKQSCDCD